MSREPQDKIQEAFRITSSSKMSILLKKRSRDFQGVVGKPKVQRCFRASQPVFLQPTTMLRTILRPTSYRMRQLSTRATQVFTNLGLSPSSSAESPISGVYSGGAWINCPKGPVTRSINPATGETLAYVREAAACDVEEALAASRAAFSVWRAVPAPRRGEVLRLIGDRLRAKKTDLGDLVSLEMGKIRTEGAGEVQEFCDIVDLAVGMSRSMPGGTVVPSERSKHFIMEVANPLGTMGCITAFNFPVAVRSPSASTSL